MAHAGLTIFFRKVDASAWLSYKDYVRHISYGLIRANLPLLYTEGFQERILLQTPSALPLGVSSLGEPFFIPTKELLKIRAEELQPFFSSHEMPVLVLSYKLEPYLSVFQTPKGVLKLQLEKQGLKKVLDEQQLKPWEATKVGIEIISSGQTIDLKALAD
ncbi:DUF2344 domain-containing protein [Coprothermobacter proteolyticus]|uniref:DUF2344 domain-containing protein n=1 Tax=Coprothermobacter proteolyticus TaxID=35786 RepID=UPI000D2F9CBD|nr:DUF2344 domain-containing protein [Coprothermobacter proteolyticus]